MSLFKPVIYVTRHDIMEGLTTTPTVLNSWTTPESGLYLITAHASVHSGSEGAKTVAVLDVLVGAISQFTIQDTIYGFVSDAYTLLAGAKVVYLNAGDIVYQRVYTTKLEYAYVDGYSSPLSIRKLTSGRLVS